MEGDSEEGEEGVEDVKRGVGVKGEGKGGCGGRGGRAKKRVWKEVYVENCSMFHLLTVFDMLFTCRELVSGAQSEQSHKLTASTCCMPCIQSSPVSSEASHTVGYVLPKC